MRGFGLAVRAVVTSLLMFAFCVAPAAAVTPGSGHWYWPTGSESFGGMSGWWDARPGCWHLAQDMPSPCGHDVYAIGAGKVLESKYVARYGPGGSDGGAVVILHTTAAGRKFKALYGHLSDLRYEKGDTVAAGAVIGKINNSSPNHLHFGVHPGEAYPSDNNPFRGHTYTSSNTYGWVDPVAYLRNNPRIIPYVAPGLPTVVSLTTSTTPIEVGAVKGVAYWMERSEEVTRAWAYSIEEGVLSQRGLEETVPAFDTKRYATLVNSARPGFTIRDRRPDITISASDPTPERGRATRISGRVRNAAGEAFQGARVTVERRSGSSWTTIARLVTSTEGAYSFSHTPSSTSHLRIRFMPPETFVGAVSSTATVAPHVSLTQPALSIASPKRNQTFWATGYLTPKHSSTSKVRILLDRYVDGRWVREGDKRAYLYQMEDRTRCRTWFSCGRTGTYRVRTYMGEDAQHAATYSKVRTFTVK